MPTEIFGSHVRFSSALLFLQNILFSRRKPCILRQHLFFSSSKFFLFSSKVIFSLRKLFSRVSHFLLSVIWFSLPEVIFVWSHLKFILFWSFKYSQTLISITDMSFCVGSNWFSSLNIFNVKFLTSILAKFKYCFKFLHSNM